MSLTRVPESWLPSPAPDHFALSLLEQILIDFSKNFVLVKTG